MPGAGVVIDEELVMEKKLVIKEVLVVLMRL